jgi:hypothetical protein
VEWAKEGFPEFQFAAILPVWYRRSTTVPRRRARATPTPVCHCPPLRFALNCSFQRRAGRMAQLRDRLHVPAYPATGDLLMPNRRTSGVSGPPAMVLPVG